MGKKWMGKEGMREEEEGHRHRVAAGMDGWVPSAVLLLLTLFIIII